MIFKGQQTNRHGFPVRIPTDFPYATSGPVVPVPPPCPAGAPAAPPPWPRPENGPEPRSGAARDWRLERFETDLKNTGYIII